MTTANDNTAPAVAELHGLWAGMARQRQDAARQIVAQHAHDRRVSILQAQIDALQDEMAVAVAARNAAHAACDWTEWHRQRDRVSDLWGQMQDARRQLDRLRAQGGVA